MTFAKLYGVTDVTDQLLRMAQGGRMPHALLLVGNPGGAQLPLALALSQYLLCENPGSRDACGTCPACIKAEKLAHPDLHFSFPYTDPKSTSESFLPQWKAEVLHNPFLGMSEWLVALKSEGKQGKIYKEECQRILQKLSLKSFESDRRILLIWRPEYLGNEGNRLLKLIEEPPDDAVVILVAEDTEPILNTILSRCQLVNVRPFTDEEIEFMLQQAGLAAGEEAKGIAQVANGDFNEAMQLASVTRVDHAGRFLDWMRRTYEGKPSGVLPWVDDISKLSRDQQKHLLHYALHFMRELVVLKVSPQAQVRLREGELETARRMARIFDLDQISQLAQLFTDGIFGIERNANAKILFLDSSLRMHRLQRKHQPVAEADRSGKTIKQH